ncbi:MAG: pseudouridine synthase [Rickettsiaceae bacterium]|nr:pseudouridine synthase [Rickettsiaceae bacterium]
MERVAKYISSCGYCSRREAEKLILSGKVKVNNSTISIVSTLIGPGDLVEIEGVILHRPKIRLWKYYKPRGFVTTHKDPEGRKTIFEDIFAKNSANGKNECSGHSFQSKHIISVGRLDIESEGLLLLTNSGELARELELPKNNFKRLYKVKAYGKFTKASLELLEKGITHKGLQYKPCKIKHIKTNLSNHWFEVEIFEGKNREIRNIFSHINMQVNRLIRIEYGPYKLGSMKQSQIEEV